MIEAALYGLAAAVYVVAVVIVLRVFSVTDRDDV